MVSVLDSGAEEPGFKLQPRRCRVTVLGKLFTSIVPLFTKKRNWFVTHVTCRLTAKNRDQLRNPTLGNRVWASFTFFICWKSNPLASVSIRPRRAGHIVSQPSGR